MKLAWIPLVVFACVAAVVALQAACGGSDDKCRSRFCAEGMDPGDETQPVTAPPR